MSDQRSDDSGVRERPTPNERTSEAPMRLHRYLALSGVDSRRHCEDLIREGRVTVDGEVVRDVGTSIDTRRQDVRVDDERVRPQPKRYFLLNKPPGYLCTNFDPEGRPRAIDLIPSDKLRLFTVGRLDEHSEGLLLVTNDGELAHKLAHPRFQVSRTYRVQVVGRPSPETLADLRKGLHFAEGFFRVDFVRKVGTQGNSTILELDLKQGQNREIRRLLARVGHKVIQLQRIAFGPLKLGRLPVGQYRALRAVELKMLRKLMEGKPPGRRAPSSGPRRPGGRTRSGERGRSRSSVSSGRKPGANRRPRRK